MSSDRTLHFSDQFVISCGTITLDLKRSQALLIRCRKKKEHLLPKGRKDVAETLEAAALRETYEETGHRVQLLTLSMPTLAPTPISSQPPNETSSPEAGAEGGDSSGRTTSVASPKLQPRSECTEPIAVQQRPTCRGKHKIIFWFVAYCDSSLPKDEGTQMGNEDFETIWAPFETVQTLLSYENDRRLVAQAVKLANEKGILGKD